MKRLPKKQKVLITGATGFIGSHLTKRLISDGWDVHIIIRDNSNLKQIQDILSSITVHKYNGSTNDTFRIIKTSQPCIVYHLASLFIVKHQPKDIDQLIRSNILFGTQLVEAMTKNNVYHLINAGTSWQHYNNKNYNPVNLYAATKQSFDDILTYYVETTRLKVITLKLFDTYGPNDPRNKLFSLLHRTSLKKQILNMSPGNQLLDLVYIDDVINAFILASKYLLQNKVDSHKTYAISSVAPVRLKKIVQIYNKVTGKNLKIHWGYKPYRSREVMRPWNKGYVLPGWDPKVSLKEGILMLLNNKIYYAHKSKCYYSHI